MPIQMLVRCDSPGCDSYEATPVGQAPQSWLNINGQATFCSWACLAIYAANVAGIEKEMREKAQAEAVSQDAEQPTEAPVDTPSPA